MYLVLNDYRYDTFVWNDGHCTFRLDTCYFDQDAYAIDVFLDVECCCCIDGCCSHGRVDGEGGAWKTGVFQTMMRLPDIQ